MVWQGRTGDRPPYADRGGIIYEGIRSAAEELLKQAGHRTARLWRSYQKPPKTRSSRGSRFSLSYQTKTRKIHADCEKLLTAIFALLELPGLFTHLRIFVTSAVAASLLAVASELRAAAQVLPYGH